MYRIFSLLACSGLVGVSLWLTVPSSAQDASPPPAFDAGASDLARRRVDDLLAQAQQALHQGDQQEATRLALAADKLARESGLQFRATDLNPGAFLARMRAAPEMAQAPVAQPLQEARPEAVEALLGGGSSPAADQVRDLLTRADADVRAGRYEQALQKAAEAETLVRQHQITLGYADIRPQHIVSAVRRHRPDLGTQTNDFQLVGHSQPADEAQPQSPAAAKEQAVQLIQAARAALQRGHYDEARQLALQASEIKNVSFGLFEDGPETVLADLERATGTRILPANESRIDVTGVSGAQREEAIQLVREAQRLLDQGQLDAAERMARQAQQMNVAYNVQDPRPELVLQDIHRARVAQGDASAVSPVDFRSPGVSPEKAQATALLQDARRALQNGQFEVARQRVQEASQYDVAYGLLEDDPTRLMQEVTLAMQASEAHSQGLAQGKPDDLRRRARQLMEQSRQALANGDPATARRLAMEADRLPVAYDLLSDRPDSLLAEIEQQAAGMPQIAGARPVDLTSQDSFSREGMQRDSFVVNPDATAETLFSQGVAALRRGDREAARYAFTAAHQSGQTLDPVRQQQLQDYLTDLRQDSTIQQASNEAVTEQFGPAQPGGLMEMALERKELRSDRLRTRMLDVIYQAEKMRDSQPEQALELLNQMAADINAAGLEDQEKARLLANLEGEIASIESYISQRRPLIELERRNNEVRNQIRVEREARLRIEQELALLVDQYNELYDSGRYAEAHHIAKQARELDPENPVTHQMFYQSQFAYRKDAVATRRERVEETTWRAFEDVEEMLIHDIRNGHELAFPDNWHEIIARRQGQPTDLRMHTEEELRVRQSLDKRVSLHFQDEPLARVIEHLNATFMINIVVDDAGLLESGITPTSPITINVDGIRLKSALNLILTPLDLSYTIEDEVLKITSRLRQQGELKPVVYPVADLVVPIPVQAPLAQFQPGTGFGLPGHTSAPVASGMGGRGGFPQVPDPLAGQFPGLTPPPDLDTAGGGSNYDFSSLTELIHSTVEPDSWAEFGGQGSISRHEGTLSLVIRQTQRVHQEITDLLEQLRRLQDLQVTIEVRFITVSDRFFERIGIDFDFNIQDSVGGPFVNDDFTPITPFGRTDINWGAAGSTGNQQGNQGGGNQGGQQNQQGGGGGTAPFGPQPTLNLQGRDSWPGRTIVGLAQPGQFSSDLDIPFRQGSFDIGVPDFGGFQPEAGIQFGMAILSDIEAFLFVQAAQGDERSNIMFAPKLTLFNGQFGTIVSALLRPFVISLQPIATGFAVGFQPIIQTIPEGVTLFVRAVVSADRRYVRLSVSPQFTNITDVFTFSFLGGAGVGGGLGGGIGGGGLGGGLGGGGIGGGLGGIGGGGIGGGLGGQGGQVGNQQGQQNQQGGAVGTVTVQQPVTDLVTVSTVVSVPDGGTVLLGGVKRLREGRNMAGVPILNKIPYVSRLFKNTGVGRETDSLMLMVTPRIIINEEEEALLGIPGN